MTPEYILTKSTCREPFCVSELTSEALARRQRSEIENMLSAPAYAEPGYTQPTKGVLFADWNYFPRGIDSILESYGYSTEWSDEWTTCDRCGNAVRTSPDSYGWKRYSAAYRGEMVCGDCIKQNPAEYLESLEDNPRACVTIAGIDPSKHGYTLLQKDYETGMHPGQTDDPNAILKAAHEAGHRRIVFTLDDVGQFDARFSAYAAEPFQVDRIIRDPGKFEGEHISVPHFWDMAMESSSNEDVYIGETMYSFFIISDDDRKQFPDLTDYGLLLWERSDGFVMSEWFETEQAYNEALAQYQRESEVEDDEE